MKLENTENSHDLAITHGVDAMEVYDSAMAIDLNVPFLNHCNLIHGFHGLKKRAKKTNKYSTTKKAITHMKSLFY